MLSRRGLIKNCLASLVAVKVPTGAFSAKNVSRYRIVAQKSEHQFYEGANHSDLFLYNGSAPAHSLWKKRVCLLYTSPNPRDS